MALASCDLQNYQLARQLHLMAHLYELFLSNAMSCPLFYESLHPSAKQRARVALLSLHRTFERSSHGSPLFMRSPYRVHTMRCILSFLMYPEYAVEWPASVSRFIRTPSTVAAAQVSGDAAAPQPLSAGPASADAPPLRLDASSDATADRGSATQSDAAAAVASSSAPQPPMQQRPPAPGSARPSSSSAAAVTVAVAGAPAPLSELMLRPLFFLRPLNPADGDRRTPFFGTTTHLYVRMVHTHLLNEESLNPFFGRYGQVGCTAIQRTPLQQYAVHLGEAATEALRQLFASSASSSGGSAADASSLYVQDFIIAVDSHQNAVHAVRRAYYKELMCIALHDPAAPSAVGEAAGDRNTHCLADVDAWMRRHAFVWRLRAELPATAGDGRDTAEKSQALSAEARRRKRHRARHRRQERRRRRRAVLGDDHDVDSADSDGSSSLSESARRRGRGSRSSTRSRSGSADRSHSSSGSDGGDDISSSSSGDEGGGGGGGGSEGEDGVAQFVPEVVLDGFPYWTTVDQLKVLLQSYGTVVEMRLSLDDLSGAFTGCVLVRMATVEEALQVSRGLHDTLYRGYRLISGVINERLEVVALEDGGRVRVPAMAEQVPYDVTLNDRVWV